MSTVAVNTIFNTLSNRFIQGEIDALELNSNVKSIIQDQAQQITSQIVYSSLISRIGKIAFDSLDYPESKDGVNRHKLSGIAILDALLDINDEIKPERRLEIANSLFKLLENDKPALQLNIEVIKAASSSIGHFARIATQSEIDYLQSSIFDSSLKFLRDIKSETKRYVGAVVIYQLAVNSPSLIFGRRKMLFGYLWEAVCDRATSVRTAAATTLESALVLVSQRESMAQYIDLAFKQIDSGFASGITEKIIGSLTVLEIVLDCGVVTMPELHAMIQAQNLSFQDLIWKVLRHKDWKDHEVRMKVLQMVPTLASSFPNAFVASNSYTISQNFLQYSVRYLLDLILLKRDRSIPFIYLGKLFVVMATQLKTSNLVFDAFACINEGFKEPFSVTALQCLGMIVSTSPQIRNSIDSGVVDSMFRGGLTTELIECLKVVCKNIPGIHAHVQSQLRNHIASILLRYSVLIDDDKHGRRIVVAKDLAPTDKHLSVNSTSSATQGSKPANKWQQNIFGMRVNTDNAASAQAAAQTKVVRKPEEEIIFALQVLTLDDFFPKQFREKLMNGMGNAVVDEDQSLLLLKITKLAVVRYLDDYNPDVRCAAAIAVASVIDTTAWGVDGNFPDYGSLYQMLDQLLLMGVGDNVASIRCRIFQALSPSLDHLIALTENIHCLIEALNDEAINVRVAATTILARVSRYDTLRVMPVVRLMIKRLIQQLHNDTDHYVREESVQLLQALVRGSDTLIKPYAKQVMDPLMKLLNDPSPAVVVAALSTVGELATASPESVGEHMETLSLQLIAALNDASSVTKQEIAVVTMGKLVSSFAMVTDEPYKKYPGLFSGLVKAIQSEGDTNELSYQAIRTVGLLGSVDSKVFLEGQLNEKVSMLEINRSNTAINFVDDDVEDELDVAMSLRTRSNTTEEKPLSAVELRYASVVIRKLVDILRDPSLASYYQIASSVAIKTVRIIGTRATPYLRSLVDGITYRLFQPESGNSLRDNLLDHIISIILIVGKSMRNYIKDVVRVVNTFFDSHQQPCLDIVEAMALMFSTPDFTFALRAIIPTFLKAIHEERHAGAVVELSDASDDPESMRTSQPYFIGNASGNNKTQSQSKTALGSTASTNEKVKSLSSYVKTSKILQKVVNLKGMLDEYRRQLLPVTIQILDDTTVTSKIRIEALCVAMHLLSDNDMQEFVSRLIHPLLRIAASKDTSMMSHIVTSLSCLVCRLGTGFVPYIIPVRRKLQSLRELMGKSPKLEEYDMLINRLLKQKPLPPEPSDTSDIQVRVDDRVRNRMNSMKYTIDPPLHLSYQALENSWALAGGGRNNASDLTGWMKRLSHELIRQSPSFIIRNCSELSKLYPPLAAELFNSSFNCIWDELFSYEVNDVEVNISLIDGIEMALRNKQIPSSIMTTLLNLVEFMDMEDKQLPMDVRLVARQAQTANMYAKSLRYREIEFNSKNMTPSAECIDALITLNNQLGRQDRAVGVLHCIRTHYQDIQVKPLWLEKLSRWEDALDAYDAFNATPSEPNAEGETEPKTLEVTDDWVNNELGRMRCLRALGEFDKLEQCSRALKGTIKAQEAVGNSFSNSTAYVSEVDKLGATASWMLGKWDTMDEFLDSNISDEAATTVATVSLDYSDDVVLEQNMSFHRAIFAIQHQDYAKASELVALTRKGLTRSIRALLSENYSRAFKAIVSMQMLAELEEIIEFRLTSDKMAIDLEALKNNTSDSALLYLTGAMTPGEKINSTNSEIARKKTALLKKWQGRLKWAPKEADVFRQILAVRALVAEPMEDLDSWLELVTLSRKEGMFSLCENILKKLGAPLDSVDGSGVSESKLTSLQSKPNDKVVFNKIKLIWSKGEKQRALDELTEFLKVCTVPEDIFEYSGLKGSNTKQAIQSAKYFRAQCLLRRAEWMRELKQGSVNDILKTLAEAQHLASDEYFVWHAWAVANYEQLKKVDNQEAKTNVPPAIVQIPTTPTNKTNGGKPAPTKHLSSYTPRRGSASLLNLRSIQQADSVTQYVLQAIQGFVKSISLGEGQQLANIIQDTLRLLTLWFSYGTKVGVYNHLEMELEKIAPRYWLSVIPQLIARIHIKAPEISNLLRKLLKKVAVLHPQALVCPISVALNTNDSQQKTVSVEVLNEMRKHNSQLVEEATMVSRELMRVAITPHELWYDGLEQAAQCYMDNKDISQMLQILLDLHDAMTNDPSVSVARLEGFSEGIGKIGTATLRDISFRMHYEHVLNEAQNWIEKFKRSGKTPELHQAWEIYQQVFKKIKMQISHLKHLELDHISPALVKATDISLAVPGTYRPSSPVISIKEFSPSIGVISSKQRPRRMSLQGSDGKKYEFLLKGHEDLRQDERVMQLFGLINVCLENDRATNNRQLSIVPYSVLPLSNNSGLIGWVQNCDTINQLVKSYRDSNGVKTLHLEAKLLQGKSLNYDKLTLMQKVEAFQQVCEETSGQDLAKMIWLKSKTSDVWVERRANFSKSTAVMSMVGYILGLGDRHPSNLMIERVSGRVVHIDFGDCFEITSQRSKYPEVIPFRLTRMLTNCMDRSGMEGTFRFACERTMQVLRDNRDSVMAMLEAFVFDPLISWRLLANDTESKAGTVDTASLGEGMKTQDSMNTIDQVASSMMLHQSRILSSDTLHEDLPTIEAGDVTAASVRDMSRTVGMSLRPSAANLSRMVSGGSARSNSQENDDEPHLQSNMNSRALEVINRIQAKLSGTDFGAEELSVEQQIDRLIKEATADENLCRLFIGWCPMW